MLTIKSISRTVSVLFILVLILAQVGPAHAAGSWMSTGALPGGRGDHAATLLPNGKVLVVGGYSNGFFYLNANLYNPATGAWTNAGSISAYRTNPTATLLPNGKVLVAGGWGSGNLPLSTELYDSATGIWTTTGSLTQTRSFHTATLLPNGKVLVAGGYSSTGFRASAELYDPDTGLWSTTGSLSQARGFHTATLLPDGKVLVAGGCCSIASAEMYDPGTGLWTTTGSLGNARMGHSALLLPNGQVLVEGGENGSNKLSTAELYDPTSGAWTPTGALLVGRSVHTATLLPDGKVLVAGGAGSSNKLASAELYDPASGVWTLTGSLAQARSAHTATLLPDGTVLVAGGYNSANIGISSTELYEQVAPMIDQTITVTTHAPASAVDGSSFTVAATASSGLPVTYSSSGACTNIDADFTMTSGTGTCTVMYNQAGDSTYNPALQVVETVTAEPMITTRYVATSGTDTGNCGNSASPCATITYAISQAVAGNTIEIAAGTYTEAGITVDKDLTITGAGSSNTIVQAATSPSGASDRVFYVNSWVAAIIEGVTIQNGNAAYGGGLYNNGTLTLNNSTFSNNTSTNWGGGIYSDGTVTVTHSVFESNTANFGGGIFNYTSLAVTDSTFSGNSATSYGGGIFNNYEMTVTNSTFLGNSASYDGGGIYNNSTLTLNSSVLRNNFANHGSGIFTNGILNLGNSTISDNTASEKGGGISNNGVVAVTESTFSGNSALLGAGISNDGTLTVANSTLSGNSADLYGGGIYNNGGTFTLTNSTISGNSSSAGGGIYHGVGMLNYTNTIIANSSGGDCFIEGTIGINNSNLAEDGSCSASLSGDPNLGTLADNGGPTQTMALLIGSLAIDAGDDATCAASPVNNLDQRGEARPFGAGCDIGAYESQVANTPPVIIEGESVDVTMSENGSPTAFALTLNATDAEEDTLNWNVPPPFAPLHGVASVNGTGTSKTISYIPETNYFGADSFVVSVDDGFARDTITVNVTINPVNDPPVITEGASVNVTMSEDGVPTPFVLTLHATDLESAPLNWVVPPPLAPLHGVASVSGTGTSKAITYIPEPNYFGTDSFVVSVDDGFDRDTITVNVTIEPVNEVPSLIALDPASAQIGSADLPLNISGTDFAPGALVRWHNSATSTITDLATTFVSESSLSAVVPSALLTSAGTFEISVFNPAPGGGASASLPFFVTQSDAEVTSSDTATSTDPAGTATASTGGGGAGTPGSITASGTGIGSITVSQYDSNPTGTSTFTSSGGYFDVYVSQGSSFSTITIVACNMSGNGKIRWWDDGSWVQVDPQTNDNGCVTMELSDTSTPTVDQLTGTIFGVEGFTFSGFLSPVDNPETVNLGKAGRTYPIKWQLKDGDGLFISDLAAITSITYTSHSCIAFSGDPTSALEISSTGATNLRYDSATNQFIYNWKTPGVGCYTLFITFDTGQVFHAYFDLK